MCSKSLALSCVGVCLLFVVLCYLPVCVAVRFFFLLFVVVCVLVRS